MKPMRQALKIVSILAATAAMWTGCQKPEHEADVVRPVKTMVLGTSGQFASRAFPGTVRAAQRAQLSFRVSGPLVRLPAYEGQTARKGELLAQVDPRDFQTAVHNLEARLADLNAQYKAMQVARPEDIRRLEAGLAAAESRLVEATATFRRYQRLYENDNISKAEYDQRRAARDVADSEVATARESLEIARSGARPEDLEAMEARIRAMESELRRAQDQLRDTELRAPYNGIVAETYVENFEYVSAFTSVLSLQDINTVEIVAQIPESVAARVKSGSGQSRFKARFPSLPNVETNAEPSEFAAQADPVTRTYAVTFRAQQPEGYLVFAGMTAEVEVSGADSSVPGFLVPVSAIFSDQGGNKNVWILDEGSDRPRKVRVELGQPSGDGIWVISGLNTGDTIITAGTHFLTEDQQVRAVTDELRDRK